MVSQFKMLGIGPEKYDTIRVMTDSKYGFVLNNYF